jgi:hypothetical protein
MQIEPCHTENQVELCICLLQGSCLASIETKHLVDTDQERYDVDEDVDIAEDGVLALVWTASRLIFFLCSHCKCDSENQVDDGNDPFPLSCLPLLLVAHVQHVVPMLHEDSVWHG